MTSWKRQPTALAIAAALTAPLLAAPAPAAAEGWTLGELGREETRPDCMQRALRVLNDFPTSQSSQNVYETEWSVMAYNLTPGDVDVVISCPHVGGSPAYYGFIHAHSELHDDTRPDMVRAIQDAWKDDISGAGSPFSSGGGGYKNKK